MVDNKYDITVYPVYDVTTQLYLFFVHTVHISYRNLTNVSMSIIIVT